MPIERRDRVQRNTSAAFDKKVSVMSADSRLSAKEFHQLPPRRRLRAIAGGSVGNLVEWYDWLAYSTFSLYFAHVFFPSGDRTAQLLSTAAVFAVGYIMRPLGAVLFGWYADRKGRKSALTTSVLMMGAGSLLVALTPGYASIGMMAPVILVTARMLQGLSVGGEYGASSAYLMEVAPARARGFYVSFHYMTLLGGQLLAVLTLIVLQFLILSPPALESWGWRIPFGIGALLSCIALILRREIDESPQFVAQHDHPKNPFALLLSHPKAVLQVLGLSLGGSVAVNTFSVYMPKFLVNTAGFSKLQSTGISAVTLLAFAAMQPIGGAISDRIGRKPCLIGFGIMGALAFVPLLAGIARAETSFEALILILAALLIATGYSSTNAVVKSELFPVGARAVGVGVPYAIVVALVGGTSEYFGLLFKSRGNETGYYYYVAGCVLFSLIFYLWIPETRPKIKEEGAMAPAIV